MSGYIQVLPNVWVHESDPRSELRGIDAWLALVSPTWPYPYDSPKMIGEGI